MLIVCGDVINFKNVAINSMCQAVLNLMSVYYVIDRHYPAMYGILLLMERYCLCDVGAANKGGQLGDTSRWKNFVNDFDAFVSSQEAAMGNI